MARILVVDDMMTIRRILRTLLTNMGHVVDEADNGQNALKMLEGGTCYDLVISDWNMPVMDGSGLVQAIRQDCCQKTIPVIMLTGEADRTRVLELAKLGINGYILKPFKQDTLEMVVKKILQA
jgi:two-component system chemotaxis response regulator CheY